MEEKEKKELGVYDSASLKEKVADVAIKGDPDIWKLICKASSESQGWMKSTKAMQLGKRGCLVQVTTQQGQSVAEALCFIPMAILFSYEDGTYGIEI